MPMHAHAGEANAAHAQAIEAKNAHASEANMPMPTLARLTMGIHSLACKKFIIFGILG